MDKRVVGTIIILSALSIAYIHNRNNTKPIPVPEPVPTPTPTPPPAPPPKPKLELWAFISEAGIPGQEFKRRLENTKSELEKLNCSIRYVDGLMEIALVYRYQVKMIPTCILFKDGAEVDRKSGTQTEEQIIAWCKPHST